MAGVALQLNERALMAVSNYLALLAAGVLMMVLAWRWRRLFVLALIGMAAMGAGSAGWRAGERLNDPLRADLQGVDIQVTGLVASLPQHPSSGLRFLFEVEQASLHGRAVHLPPLLAIGWYSGFRHDAVLSPLQRSLAAGQRWRFTLRLRQPHGNLNPHGFDYELALFEQGVRATGYVRAAPAPELLASAAAHPVERARQYVRDAIEASVNDRRAAGVLAALSVGDQSAIARDDWDLFRKTGVAHLMSISGLHITMFAWLAGLGIAFLWRRVSGAMLWLPVQIAARWGGLLAAAAYAVFSGWGVPSQRTVWMLATVTVLQSLSRRWPWPLVLLTAAGVVSLFDPWAVLQPGFWLSFVAVGLLMGSGGVQGIAPRHDDAVGRSPGWRGRGAAVTGHFRGELRSQVIATVGLTPLTLVFFQQVSLVGLLANLVAIPVVTLVITPLALLGTLAAPLWGIGAWVVRALCAGLEWLAAMPASVFTVGAAPAWAQAAGLVGAALLVLPLPWRLRALAVPLVLPLLLPNVERPAPGQFELIALDVGQGSAVIVRTHDHLLVYDTGPRYSLDSDAGQRVLLPLLRARGENHIDRLMLSHRDTDHVGGARTVLTNIPVLDLWSSLENGHPLFKLAPVHRRCEEGQAWDWDGVHFALMQPPAQAYGTRRKSNAMSCVLRVAAADSHSVLLTGDIERDQETWLVATQARALKSDVLIAPHHGSKTSSSALFLDAVKPRTAVFQAGYRNRFGHPAAEVVARYGERGIATVDSVHCGAWTWHSAKAGQGVCERDRARRYWHHVVPRRAPTDPR
jgi:competence protein ComEC